MTIEIQTDSSFLALRDRWRAVVNTVMNLQVIKRLGISWLAEQLSSSQEGLCFIESVMRNWITPSNCPLWSEPKDSTPLIPKPVSEHDPEPVPSPPILKNYLPKFHVSVILSSRSLNRFPNQNSVCIRCFSHPNYRYSLCPGHRTHLDLTSFFLAILADLCNWGSTS
jgi:hypothetical protein